MIETFNLFKKEIFKALLETFDMLFTSLIISFTIGLLIGFVLYITRKDGVRSNKVIYFIISTIINIIRSVPFILFIIILIPFNRMLIGTGFGVNASKIPLSLIGIATFARLSMQSFLDVNDEIYETSYALGSNLRHFLFNFLLVDARSSLVLGFVSTTVSVLAYSTVMGIIGGGGLGYLAISEGYNNFNYPLMWIIIIVMVILVGIIQTIGSMIAKHLNKK